MTLFVNLRGIPSGGIVADEAQVLEDGATPIDTADFAARIRGRDMVLATHGFNVGQKSGVNALTIWGEHYGLASPAEYVGVLWPGDSRFLPILDYPVEGAEANRSGRLLAKFLNRWAAGAASLSFVSHSLGARMVLETVRGLERGREVRRMILMAGAIEDDCLVNEYRDAAARVQEITVVASREDWVLQFAFPIGNPIGEIVMRGHPYFNAALGREGPSEPIPLTKRGGAWQIPDRWDIGHLDYLPGERGGPQIPPPVVAVPGPDTPEPVDPTLKEWKSSWSAAVASRQLE